MRHFFLFLLTSLMPLQFAESALECTLSMIKPDAVCNNHSGKIISRLEKNGLHLAAIKMVQVTKAQAMQFYKEHEKRPFYDDLTDFLSSGPVIVMVLKGDDAIKKNREIMGATDPKEAKPGTLRYDFATSKQRNAVHGSDSLPSAEREIAFFFKPQEIHSCR